MHLKRNNAPSTWPIPRKAGNVFLARPRHAQSKGISLLILLRDVLGIVRNKHEARYMALNGMIKVNGKVRKDVNFPMQVFDTLSLEKGDMYFRLEIVNRRFHLKQIKKEEAPEKIAKITGKKILKNGRVQMNLWDGINILTKERFSVGDSVILNIAGNKIVDTLRLKEGAKVEIILGKHMGERGVIKGFNKLRRETLARVEIDKKEVEVPLRALLVIK